MPSFTYTAKDATGRLRSGVMQADSEAAVVRTLDQRALYPVRIAPEDQAARNGLAGLGGRRVKARHLGTAYGQLSDLLSAGVPMLRALDILARTSAHPGVSEVFRSVEEDVAAGATLADAMAKHPQAFGDLHVAMVRAGEAAGFLEDVLTNLSEFLERQDDLRSKVTGAMIYPILLACFATVAVLIMLIWLVPQFADFLGDTPLPLPSVVLFSVSEALRANWPLLLGVVVAAVLLTVSWLRSEVGRKLWDRWKLHLPLAGRAVRMVAITRFCRVFGTMMANGINILEALTISKDATGNALMSEAIEEAGENVRAGESLAEPLRRSEFFPTEIIEMIAIAEESNQLEKVLLQIADTVERRTNRQVDAAVRLIEPLMLMLMAGVIGFIAMGLLYPIFTMAQHVRS
ncbi:MAG: type II secretion system F family protein [Planctomycetota bacterium]|jgi:general secretion pathway protein F/type IV pilus assembly protein PilC